MSKWTNNMTSEERTALRERQIRNLQIAIDGLTARKAAIDPDVFKAELDFMEKQIAEKRMLWKAGK